MYDSIIMWILLQHFICLIYNNFPPVFCNNGDLRLMGGTAMYEGRVEICYNETWGTICDEYWSTNAANVACKQLGFLDTGNGILHPGLYFQYC